MLSIQDAVIFDIRYIIKTSKLKIIWAGKIFRYRRKSVERGRADASIRSGFLVLTIKLTHSDWAASNVLTNLHSALITLNTSPGTDSSLQDQVFTSIEHVFISTSRYHNTLGWTNIDQIHLFSILSVSWMHKARNDSQKIFSRWHTKNDTSQVTMIVKYFSCCWTEIFSWSLELT